MRSCPKCGATYPEDVQYCPTDGSALGPELGGEQGGDPRIGTLIDRYRVVEVLGEGGMGMVYKAEHTLIGRPVAMKLLHPDLARMPEAVDRFFREARAANEVPSEHIVEVTDFGTTEDGANFLVMEFLTGVSLHDLLEREKRLAPARAARIAVQIAEGLAAAHQRGVVHRDLKPGNVQLVQRDADPEYVKLLDFGIAKITESGTQLTKTGMILGSPAYMSPEQASGKPVDHRTDIYALGVMLYEMLVGSPPFTGEGPTQILLAHVMKEPPTPRSLDPGVPEALEQLVLRCLAKDPEQRPASMTEVQQYLVGWLASAGDAAEAPALAVAAGAVAPTLLPGTPGPPSVSPAPLPGTVTGPPAPGAAPIPATVTDPGQPLAAGGPTAQVGLSTGGPITTGVQGAPGVQTMPVQAGGSNKGLLIGLAVGGALLLAGVAVAAVLLFGDNDKAPDPEAKPDPAAKVAAAAPDAAPSASTTASTTASTIASRPDATQVAARKPDAGAAVAQPEPAVTPKPRRPHNRPEPRPEPKPEPKPETRPEPKPKAQPMVTIVSVPRGAGVYSQGRMIGRAPVKFSTRHTFGVTLRMQGFQDRVVNIPAGTNGPMTVRLVQVPEWKRTQSLHRLKDLYNAGQMSRGARNARIKEIKRLRDRHLDQAKMYYKQGRISKPELKQRIRAIKERYR